MNREQWLIKQAARTQVQPKEAASPSPAVSPQSPGDRRAVQRPEAGAYTRDEEAEACCEWAIRGGEAPKES